MRRILITGSRDWPDCDAVWKVLDSELDSLPLTVIHGAARGADTHAQRWVEQMKKMGLDVCSESYPANWEGLGKRAGILRNIIMVELGADVCHAFPLGESRGTRHCMKAAASAGIPVVEHEVES